MSIGTVVPSSLGVDQFAIENAFDMTNNSTKIEQNEVEKYVAKSFSKSSMRGVK